METNLMKKALIIPLMALFLAGGMAFMPKDAPVPAAVGVEVASAAPAQSARDCNAVVQAARNGGHPVIVAAGGLFAGACYGYVWVRGPWWNNNFDRHLNRCWPNCSNWDFVRMMFGIP